MPKWKVGVCVMKVKLESAPMQSLLNLISKDGKYEIITFGEEMIFTKDINEWPICHILITFHSSLFPISKVLSYIRLRKPFLPNDLGLGYLLLDRRLTLAIIDAIDLPTPPKRIINNISHSPLETLINSDSPLPEEVIEECIQNFALNLRDPNLFPLKPSLKILDNGSITMGDITINRPFIEKPVDSNDHSLIIYYKDGGARKLHRKIDNRSSTQLKSFFRIRDSKSHIYEEMLESHDSTDIKLYAVGPSFVHAEKRKAPHIDGIVKRRGDGLEDREVVEATEEEKNIAREVVMAFGQTVCGMDVVRVLSKNGCLRSYLLDVNGWSFVKGDSNYLKTSAEILLETFNLFIESKVSPRLIPSATSFNSQKERDIKIGKLRVHVSIFRHADRTPKSKMKFSLQNDFLWSELRNRVIPLLKGESTTILNDVNDKTSTSLNSLSNEEEREVTIRDGEEMIRIGTIIENDWKPLISNESSLLDELDSLLRKLRENFLLPGTKLQLRSHSSASKKVSITLKWGGDLTHSGRIQSQILGNHYQRELLSLNPTILNHLKVYTGTEGRVVGSAENFSKALLNVAELPPQFLIINKEALDDSLVGKDVIEKVKKDLLNSFDPTSFVTMKLKELYSLLMLHRPILLLNTKSNNVSNEQRHFCSQSDMFDRWNVHFSRISSKHTITPSMLSDIHDSLKYDLLHHREYFLSSFLDVLNKTNCTENTNSTLESLERMVKLCDDLFNHITPYEYGSTMEERLRIGVKISGALLSLVIETLSKGKKDHEDDEDHSAFIFTKESHIIALLNIVQEIQFPLKGKKKSKELFESSDFMDEMDYLSHIVFEIYKNDDTYDDSKSTTEFIRIGLSHGADHHSLSDDHHLQPIKPIHWLSAPLDKEEVLRRFRNFLSSHQ